MVGGGPGRRLGGCHGPGEEADNVDLGLGGGAGKCGCSWDRFQGRENGVLLLARACKRNCGRTMTLTSTVLTEDFEVDGCILLSSLIFGDAHVFRLVALVHLPDGQLGTVIAEDVLLVFLVLYLFPVPTWCKKANCHDFGRGSTRFIFNPSPQNAD